MIASDSKNPNPAFRLSAGWICFFAVVLGFVCAVAVSRQSFWIDEVYTPYTARQPSFAAWWREVFFEKGSNLQAPLYMFWIWGCAQIFGTSEWALRAVNLFWFAPALLTLTWALAGRRTLQLAAFLTAALSPFAWYYLNEGRPYTMQLGASLFLFALILHWWLEPDVAVARERWRVWSFAGSLVLLCGSSMLAMILAVAPLFTGFVLLPGKRLRELSRAFWPVWMATLVVLLGLGLYYLWTLHQGARATAVATTGAKNLVFIGYELFGFSGLGPGRLEMRDGGLGVFKAYAPALALYTGVVAALLGFAGWELRRKLGGKKLAALILAALTPAGFILAAGVALHFRVLGRHMMTLAPLAFLLLTVGVTAAWRQGKWGRVVVAVFFTLYLASSLSLRFAARHEKDNYRGAAAIAKMALASGQSVWWNADEYGAYYYQVPLATNGVAGNGQALWWVNPSSETLLATRPADVIIASRRDVYDARGALQEFLARADYRVVTNLTAFTVWERAAK